MAAAEEQARGSGPGGTGRGGGSGVGFWARISASELMAHLGHAEA